MFAASEGAVNAHHLHPFLISRRSRRIQSADGLVIGGKKDPLAAGREISLVVRARANVL